uniref:Si:dkey-18j18.3 n=1 Tax=Neogobius melanostomus TaxID=47308 RepID=A0A8C6V7Q3_9GOBI
MRRVSSAGYRLQPRTTLVRPKSSEPSAGRCLYAQGDSAQGTRQEDPVKQDQIWRELVWSERRGVKEWENNWDFLKNFDQTGEPKTEKPLPSYVPFFSDHLPNTNNQMIGSRLNTPMGKELVKMERLLFLSSRHQRRKHVLLCT